MTRRDPRFFAVLLATACLAACAADEGEDLGDLGPGGKADTDLPRTVEVELEPGDSQFFRVTTAAFVATLEQAGDVPAQLVAKNFDLEFESEVSPAPQVEVIVDDTVRTWTLTVHNRGDATLDAVVVIDVPHAGGDELGIVSDIDKTILPPGDGDELALPYPGIAALLTAVELRAGGSSGDITFVTARTPEGVVGVAEWLTAHGVPAGPIETGISGVPFIAQKEKVADISRLFEAHPEQQFVLFGDTSHRDPEVYAEVRTLFPDQVTSIFIHKVNVTVNPDRVIGMNLVENYAQAAAIAFGQGILTEVEAREVMTTARDQGLAITDAEIDALIDDAS